MIEDALQDGSQFGAHIVYSPEGSALETAGGIAKARHLLGEVPFVAIAGDVFCPYFDYTLVKDALQDEDVWGKPHPEHQRDMAWLYLVKNPAHNPKGDFALHNFSIANTGELLHTFSGIGVYRPAMFDSVKAGDSAKLAPLLREFADQGKIGGELYRGDWTDVGTVERLNQLNAPIR